jgi:hypothetical protein
MRKLAIALLVLAYGTWAQTRTASTWSGLLLDAGCAERSLDNLRAPPTDTLAMSNEPQASAKGIKVSPRIVQAERAGAMLPRTTDHASRYSSASCALTADTKAFMLLLSDGTLLNLDEGGNTLAFEAFQATPAGQAILNGKVGGLKPQASVTAVKSGDRLKVRSVELVQSQPAPAK